MASILYPAARHKLLLFGGIQDQRRGFMDTGRDRHGRRAALATALQEV